MAQQSIVIYRSEIERQADLFWVNNPEYVVYFILFVVLIVGVFFAWDKVRYKVRNFINRNKRNRRR